MPAPVPPGPRAAPFGLPFIRRFQTDPLRFITEVGQTYGDLAYFRMGPVRACFVNSPDLIREVLIAATFLQRFRLRLVPDQAQEIEPEPLLAIRPKGGLRMVISAGR